MPRLRRGWRGLFSPLGRGVADRPATEHGRAATSTSPLLAPRWTQCSHSTRRQFRYGPARSPIIARRVRILSLMSIKFFFRQRPGVHGITQTRSGRRSNRLALTAEAGVPGLSATTGLAPAPRIACKRGGGCGADLYGWAVITPATGLGQNASI